jgi:hypothetical protein
LCPELCNPYSIGLLASNIPSILPTYHPNIKEEEEDPGYNSKVSAAAATNIHGKAANTNSSPLLREVMNSYNWHSNSGAILGNIKPKDSYKWHQNSGAILNYRTATVAKFQPPYHITVIGY